ncbi:MAG TPA: phosphoribosyltransferase family protein [Anaeromyxobacteraceae bacterium]|nr:phosphoribosyltransferase family protein [Anaeromyxobacteraceae bacterium]
MKKPSRRRQHPRAEQPLGVGVGDPFAMKRLRVPSRRRESGVREVGWAEFGELSRGLAERIAQAYRPEVVLGVVPGGVFLGGALAMPLRAEFRSVRIVRVGTRRLGEHLRDLQHKSVLLVDDVTASGRTLAAATRSASRAGAREVKTATLVVRPNGHRPDFFALETKALVVFGWDYQLHPGEPGSGDPGEVGV